VKVGDLVRFPGPDIIHDHDEFGMIVEIYESPSPACRADELFVDVFWPDGELIYGYIAGDFEVISESR